MLEVKAEGVDPLVAKFDKLAAQVEALHHDMPDELTAWQVEDMRRKYPNIAVTQAPHQTTAETDIWPRSRQEGNRKQRRAAFKQPKRYRLSGNRVVRSARRAILRPELFAKLQQRMSALIKKAMAWP
jgi:hypothetical protein